MRTTTKDGHTVITAKKGYALKLKGAELYAKSFSLGSSDSKDNYEEVTEDSVPAVELPEELLQQNE